ncbi:MAG: alanine--tRNA ligase [Deltaproteobacteria bacterium]|nr:alanine--tRNA ligase [Deltaproteobacteria bacterium]
MKSAEIRKSFLDFFKEHGHEIVPSSGLIPKDDPTLLFTNSGMVQFKDCFLGLDDRYTRATSSQKCVRAGGKHNDLENVGYTARHHTFFEMLGNFSFGDYFKRESIRWGWEFLTERMNLPKEKLWVTVYEEDEDAFNIWHQEMGVPLDRIVRMGKESNFWEVGETGPCGPCSEILFDQGPSVGCGRPDCDVFCDCDRHLEIWNHVFTQFDRTASGDYVPLPKPNIDTGMGLERLTAVVQGVKSNYDTDLFMPIISFIAQLCGKKYPAIAESDSSIRVIADHSRAITFLLGDGVLPSNEGRGYTLRRILRRAARHGRIIGMDKPFLHEVVSVVVDVMKEAYPDIVAKEAFIKKVVFNEEERFGATLDGGLRILSEEMVSLEKSGGRVLAGEVAFKLYDSYGFPLDLTADVLRRSGFVIDDAGFERAMLAQKKKSRESWKGSGEETVATVYKKLSQKGVTTNFIGYDELVGGSTVVAILSNGEEVASIKAGQKGEVLVASTPFYGEKGGQVGDTGEIVGGNGAKFVVTDTQEPVADFISHIGFIKEGEIKLGDMVVLHINSQRRRAICAHHSATHIINAALRAVLGEHVKQSGSFVDDTRLRFDFTHFSRLEEGEIKAVEDLANRYVLENSEVQTMNMDKDAAMQSGACAVFGEKYAAEVRVVQMGSHSTELCGGVHVKKTGDIGFIKIIAETSVSAGVRRLEAVVGLSAVAYISQMETQLKSVAAVLRVPPEEIALRIEKVLQHQKDLEREIEHLKAQIALQSTGEIAIKDIRGIRLLAMEVNATDVKTLRELGDRMRDKVGSGVVLLASKMADGKAMLLCLITKDLTGRYHAGEIVKQLAPLVGGSGGGKADMAQAGGANAGGIPDAMKKVEELL